MSEKIILASASPRRKELLSMIYSDFEVCVSEVEEIVPPDILPLSSPEYLARLKAEDVAKSYPDCLVIGADTSVFVGDKILGKPKNRNDAFNMLSMLSGNVHKVVTGCAIVKGDRAESFSVTTEVEFYKLTDSQIWDYIDSGDPFDKAGGYGIQTDGVFFVKSINGDYNNVVGLPVAELYRQIKVKF